MRKIDAKHHIEGDQIIKTSNSTPIPLDEPTFLFRGRDKLALPTLMIYRNLCVEDGCNQYHLELLDEMINKFLHFEHNHADKMKQPGITEGK